MSGESVPFVLFQSMRHVKETFLIFTASKRLSMLSLFLWIWPRFLTTSLSLRNHSQLIRLVLPPSPVLSLVRSCWVWGDLICCLWLLLLLYGLNWWCETSWFTIEGSFWKLHLLLEPDQWWLFHGFISWAWLCFIFTIGVCPLRVLTRLFCFIWSDYFE